MEMGDGRWEMGVGSQKSEVRSWDIRSEVGAMVWGFILNISIASKILTVLSR